MIVSEQFYAEIRSIKRATCHKLVLMREGLRQPTKTILAVVALLSMSTALSPVSSAKAQSPPAQPNAETEEQPWLEPIPVPFDPELEAQIQEVQQALSTIHQQMVRRKEALQKAQDTDTKAKLYDELEALRHERDDLEAVLHELVNEAKASQRTAIDEAVARARWLERQQEYWEKKEELLRDRQTE